MKMKSNHNLCVSLLSLLLAIQNAKGQSEKGTEVESPKVVENETAKTPFPKVEWKEGKLIIEEQTKLIRANQNDLVKALQGVVSGIQASNRQLELSLKNINDQQSALSEKLTDLSIKLNETIKSVQSNADQSTKQLNQSISGIADSLKGVESKIAGNQKKVEELQVTHSGLLSKLSESATTANKGVEENKKLLQSIQSDNTQIQNKISNMETEIGGLETKRKENHEAVETALGEINSELTLSFVLKVLVSIAAIGLGFYVWKNKRMITEILSGGKLSDQTQIETIFTDERYIDGLNRAINLLNATQQAAPAAEEKDHGLPLSVADEINRMRIRLAKMEKEDVKVRPLWKALERMEEKLQGLGYEIVDLTGKSYVEGMTAKPTIIPDDSLAEDESIIRRVITPLVNYRGKLIQVPEIEVGVGG
jgi:predicted  nucleic acid-binding Zn-ribbon protein